MTPWSYAVALSQGLAAFTSVATIALWCRLAGSSRTHIFFLIYVTITTLYLQVGPAISLLNDDFDFGATQHAPAYVFVQVLALTCFQLPFVCAYLGRRRSVAGPRSQVLVARSPGCELVALGGIVFAALFLVVVVRNDLFFTRLGHEGLARNFVNLPTLDFIVFRLFQDSCFFLFGVLFYLARSTRDRQVRALVLAALTAMLASWGCWAIMNSRLMIVLALALLLGWWLSTSVDATVAKKLFALTMVVAVGIFMLNVVMNVRRMGFEGGLRLEHLSPEFEIFGDSQGFRRINGVDLMARMTPEIHRRGPAWGSAWGNIIWTFRRFLDPVGFDQFRLELRTNAKHYLMWEYLGWDVADYFSCTLTDLYGNFHAAGFVALALLLARLFSGWAEVGRESSSPVAFLIVLFLLTHAMSFDQEAVTLLFHWMKKLPILLLVIAARPFAPSAVTDEARRGEPPGRPGPSSPIGDRAGRPLSHHSDLAV